MVGGRTARLVIVLTLCQSGQCKVGRSGQGEEKKAAPTSFYDRPELKIRRGGIDVSQHSKYEWSFGGGRNVGVRFSFFGSFLDIHLSHTQLSNK